MYAYCANNPISHADPTGEIAWAIIGAIAGAVIGATIGAIASYQTTGKVDWKYVAVGAVGGALIGAGLGAAAQAIYGAFTATAAVTAVEATTTVGGAACADGDCTNEAKQIAEVSGQAFKTLEANMNAAGQTRVDSSALHHLVAQGASGAQDARNVLERLNISIQNSANGVYLPEALHHVIHTKEYYTFVNNAMSTVNSLQEYIDVARKIIEWIVGKG